MLTILTEPINALYRTKISIEKYIKGQEYGGHPVRTQRLLEGFESLGYSDYNYRPISITDVGNHVHVLANYKALQYAIELKKRGRIERLTAGPNIAVFPFEYDNILNSPLIDLIVQPSEWVVNMWCELNPSMKKKCVSLPFGGCGIDVDRIKPNYSSNRNGNVLVYYKYDYEQLLHHVMYILSQKGYNVHLLRYGSYSFDEYLRKLDEVEFMVTISGSEASGNYLFEAWAKDVPTICYDLGFQYWSHPYNYSFLCKNLSCPYLSEYTGVVFREISELENILNEMDWLKLNWKPREWIMSNMTMDNVSKLFLSTIGIDA